MPATGHRRSGGLLSGQSISLNLGEVLRGDRIMTSDMELAMLEDTECSFLCKREISRRDLARAREMVRNGYVVEWIVDNLPGATSFVTVDKTRKYYAAGFKLGFTDSSSGKPRYFVNNHHTVVLRYRRAPGRAGNRGAVVIVGFEVYTKSIGPTNHAPRTAVPPTCTTSTRTSSCTCRPTAPASTPNACSRRRTSTRVRRTHPEDLDPDAADAADAHLDDDGATLTIPYTYSVYFRETTPSTGAAAGTCTSSTRRRAPRSTGCHRQLPDHLRPPDGHCPDDLGQDHPDRYQGLQQRDGIISRRREAALQGEEEKASRRRRSRRRRSYRPSLRAKKEKASPGGGLLEQDGAGAGASPAVGDDDGDDDGDDAPRVVGRGRGVRRGHGLELLHGDVFRPPAHGYLLAPLVGSGMQLLFMAVGLVFLSAVGLLNPSFRGGFLSFGVGLFVFAGLFSGYFSARVYRTLEKAGARPDEPARRRNTAVTALLFPGLLFAPSSS